MVYEQEWTTPFFCRSAPLAELGSAEHRLSDDVLLVRDNMVPPTLASDTMLLDPFETSLMREITRETQKCHNYTHTKYTQKHRQPTYTG